MMIRNSRINARNLLFLQCEANKPSAKPATHVDRGTTLTIPNISDTVVPAKLLTKSSLTSFLDLEVIIILNLRLTEIYFDEA